MCPSSPGRDNGFASSILEHSLNPIVVINPDGSIKYVNPAFTDLTGFSFDEIVDIKPPFPYWHRDYLRQYSQKHLTNSSFRTERLFQKKNGEEFWIEVSATPVTEAGRIIFHLVDWVDITSRKRASEALKATEAFNTSLLENAPNPILVGSAEYRITYVNHAFEVLTGYTSHEVLGKTPPFPWSLDEKMSFVIDQATGEETCSQELCHKKKNGETFWIAANIKRVWDNGKPSYVLANWVDITERKKMEAERRDMEGKAQIANRLASIGEMAAGIAHEINNPLTSIIGYTDLLMRKDLPAETKQTLEIVSIGAHRVADIVQRLLFFARQSKPMRDFVSLNQLVENTLQLRAHQLKLNNIEVITSLAPNLPQVMADGGQMQQVFLNIIANAETEMSLAHGKGTLWIASEQKPGAIQISFKDDGPGITSENMQKLFQPFFTTRALGKGTGLGLSVCHGIVTEHKGRIWAESQSGNGATFFVELPLINQPQPP